MTYAFIHKILYTILISAVITTENSTHSDFIPICNSCNHSLPPTLVDGETVETVSDFILGGSKITADGDCSHEIKRCLLRGKVMTNLDSILKSKDITLPTKVCLVKAMVFPVVMYGCERWNIRKLSTELMLLNCGVGEDS